MVKEYFTVEGTGIGTVTEKKSRFIATVFCTESEDDAKEKITALKKKYWDARHNCYAYVIGTEDSLERQSDDGEPSHTAGMPILSALKDAGLNNVCCVVTRYFGGVLLGTGGLTRAYREAAVQGIANSVIKKRALMCRAIALTDYAGQSRMLRILSGEGIESKETLYEADAVKIIFHCSEEKLPRIEAAIREATAGRGSVAIDCLEYVTIS
ncbi:MAG: IMPACT family protein [Lachnospiraceae bacterium]|nr:IMPACT family protein [Lachnospiraceae bacterium]